MLKTIFLVAIAANVFLIVSSTDKCCGENETYEDCPAKVCRPKKCSDLGFPLNCPDEKPDGSCPGKPGCICKFGYVRDKDGVCISSKNCPSCGGDKNAVAGCGVNCNKHCSDIGKEPGACILLCYPNGCDCKDGYYLDDKTGKCVLPCNCSAESKDNPGKSSSSSSSNSSSQSSASSNSNNNGKSASNSSASSQSSSSSSSKSGKSSDSSSNSSPSSSASSSASSSSSSKSPKPDPNCPNNDKCPRQNEVYDPCPIICAPDTCDSIGKSYNCPNIPSDPYSVPGYCKPACKCKPNYFRNLINQCISKDDCLKCTGSHEYFSCGGACDNVCATIKQQNQTHCPIINITCNRKCYCEEGYARDANNICIPIDQCEEDSCTPTSTEPPVGDDAQVRLIEGNVDFTGNFLYEVINYYPLTSVVMSPFSVLVPLAELALYTDPGTSYDQLLNTLNLKNKAEIRSVFPVLLSSLQAQKEAILDLAAKVYVNENYQLTENFEEDTRVVFGAEAETIDFSKPDEAADTINAWVEEESRERIKNIVTPNLFSADTRIVLANIIYFLGNWQEQFNVNDTEEADFHINNKLKIKVPMMYRKDTFKYAESKDLDCKILEIPYKGGNFSYVIFLPNEVEGYNSIAEKIRDPDVFNGALDLLQSEPCFLYVPRHEISTTIDLTVILKKLQITDLFEIDKSNLNGILKSKDKIGVSAAIQKADIKVDEVGTEAAAANVIVGTTSSSPTNVYTFRADKPFIFYLLLNRNPLFCGAYVGEALK